MAVYCEPRTDTDLLDETRDAKRILVAGCPYCANVSYSIHKKLPMFELTPTGLEAVGTRDEIDRLTHLFAQRGVHVDSWLPGFPASLCMLDEEARKNLLDTCEGIDTIITLSCETGTKNVGDFLRGKKVVGGMNARGLLSGVTKTEAGKLLLDRQTVNIKKFVFE
jgi:hypothetical protein